MSFQRPVLFQRHVLYQNEFMIYLFVLLSCMKITFHVVLSPHFQFDSRYDAVYLVFENGQYFPHSVIHAILSNSSTRYSKSRSL